MPTILDHPGQSRILAVGTRWLTLKPIVCPGCATEVHKEVVYLKLHLHLREAQRRFNSHRSGVWFMGYSAELYSTRNDYSYDGQLWFPYLTILTLSISASNTDSENEFSVLRIHTDQKAKLKSRKFDSSLLITKTFNRTY